MIYSYLRFPFNALAPDEYFLELVKYQLAYFAFEQNNPETRKKIEETINDLFKREGTYMYGVICDGSNNPPEIVNERKIVVFIDFRPTSLVKTSSKYILTLLQVWNKNQAAHFNDQDYVQTILDADIQVEKVEVFRD